MRQNSIRYFVDSKRSLDLENNNIAPWDIFISAFNDSERIRIVFEKISAHRKYWLNLPEYQYTSDELPDSGEFLSSDNTNEADFIINTLGKIDEFNYPKSRICIDITGLMRPHILFILKYLKNRKVDQIDMLYTEPLHYEKKAETKFTLDNVYEVRQVAGYEGVHSSEMSNDILIIGAGYDHELISRVVLDKDNARLVMLQSLPSLSADMYHESILRLDRVSSFGRNRLIEDGLYFSSANDPYITAAVLSEAYTTLSRQKKITNLYLSPLATKPQALGFGLFFISELENQPASIIFPFSKSYSRATSTGIGRSWIYPVVF